MSEVDRSDRAAPLLPAIAFAFVAILIAWGSDSPARDSSAVQYQRAVELLIKDGWFELDYEDGERRVALTDKVAGTELGELILGSLRGLRDLEPTLRRDMDNASLWTFADGSQARGAAVTGFEVDEGAPWLFRNNNSWRGEIRYARQPKSSGIPLVHVATGRTLNFTGGANIERLRGASNVPRINVETGQGGINSAPIHLFHCANAPAARMHRIGQELVIQKFTGSACDVFLGNRRLGSSAYCRDRDLPADQCNFAVVRLGDQVSFRSSEEQGSSRMLGTFQRQRPLGEKLIMRRDARDNKISDDPQFAGLVQAFANDIRDDVRGCDPSKSGLDLECNDPLTLSIDYSMQRETEEALKISQRKSLARSATVVMNALNGEIAAMAGMMDEDRQGDCIHPAMCPFPIGSTAKPIFATAMIAATDEYKLETLKTAIRPGRPKDVIGLTLRSDFRNLNGSGESGFVDLEDFVKYSDNYFIASLALLASSTPSGTECKLPKGETFELEGKRLASRAQSAFETDRCTPIRDSEEVPDFRPPWANSLKELFALDPYSRSSMPQNICEDEDYLGNRSYDGTPWRRLLMPSADRCAIAPSGLQRQYFRIHEQIDFRTQTIPMLLGNGEGRFTAVKLAESYSRLVTGRKIRSSLLSLDGRSGTTGGRFSRRADEARVAVSRGMAQVLDGTARGTPVPAAIANLSKRLKEGYRIGAFSKTGTIDLVRPYSQACRGQSAQDCEGKAFVITVAVYRDRNRSDTALGDLMPSAQAAPRCAVTIAVNLPQYSGPGGNRAAEVAAKILSGTVGDELVRPDGEFCAR